MCELAAVQPLPCQLGCTGLPLLAPTTIQVAGVIEALHELLGEDNRSCL